jgi:ParB-like chromosome segregation protein Spo0J
MSAKTTLGLTREISLTSSTANNGYFESVGMADQPPALKVPVASLVPGFYLRQEGTNPAHVQLLADAAGSTRLPPILVQKNSLRIIDGMHRYEAAKLCGEDYISAFIVNCSDEEAFILAVRSNTLHGLPLSKADRLSGAKRILMTHPDWSDRAVAEVTGLSAKTVGVLRNRSTDAIPLLGKRLGRDGKQHPVSGLEGRRRAADYINSHPDASLRQVSRAVDVSLGTVHDVRERIRRGTDPLGRHGSSQESIQSPSETAPLQSRPSYANSTEIRAAKRNPHIGNNAQQLSWLAISAKLANDPTLRYTEGGRAFLRWMALHAANAEEWREFVDAIPVHWLGDMSAIAGEISNEWRRFAEQLKSKRESAS